MKKWVTAAIILGSSLLGCVSFSPKPTYQKSQGGNNGWEVRLEERHLPHAESEPLSYMVSYRYRSFLMGPGGGTTRDVIETFAFFRCAELARELGRPYFILKTVPNGLLDPMQKFDPLSIDYGSQYFTELSVHHSIVVFKSREEAAAHLKRYQHQVIYEASAVMEHYQSAIRR